MCADPLLAFPAFNCNALITVILKLDKVPVVPAKISAEQSQSYPAIGVSPTRLAFIAFISIMYAEVVFRAFIITAAPHSAELSTP